MKLLSEKLAGLKPHCLGEMRSPVLAAVMVWAGLLMVTPAISHAEEYKIATVDMARVVNESKEAKSKRQELDKLSMNAKKKVEKRRDELKKIEEKLKSGNVKADSAEAERYRKEGVDFARFVKDTEEEFKREFIKSQRELTERAVRSIEKYAKANDIDLVLEHSRDGRGSVIFGASTADITNQVIKDMNG